MELEGVRARGNWHYHLFATAAAVVGVACMAKAAFGGDPAAWLTAVAALAAVVAAVAGGREASRLYSLEAARDAARAEDARRVQASQVSVWLGPEDEWERYYIWNASNAAVTDVVVTVGAAGEVVELADLGVVPPSPEPERILISDDAVDVYGARLREQHRQVHLRLDFTDAAGNRWYRTPHEFGPVDI